MQHFMFYFLPCLQYLNCMDVVKEISITPATKTTTTYKIA